MTITWPDKHGDHGHPSELRGAAPGGAARRGRWRLVGLIMAALLVYSVASALPSLAGGHAPAGAHPDGALLVARVGFEVMLTAALVASLYWIAGGYIAGPVREMEAFLHLLADLADTREEATYGHAKRVSALSASLAEILGLSPEAAERVACAALLHDIGKVGVPDRILQKDGPLDDGERETMMGHAAMGARIVARAGPLASLAPLIRHHHEWWNGSGYPDSLAGDSIPLGAAIIAVADALDAMTSRRPYRPARPMRDALAELRGRAGTQFAPSVVEALSRILPEDGGVAAPRPNPGHPTLAEQHHAARLAADAAFLRSMGA